jgi:hypothetical protein
MPNEFCSTCRLCERCGKEILEETKVTGYQTKITEYTASDAFTATFSISRKKIPGTHLNFDLADGINILKDVLGEISFVAIYHSHNLKTFHCYYQSVIKTKEKRIPSRIRFIKYPWGILKIMGIKGNIYAIKDKYIMYKENLYVDNEI